MVLSGITSAVTATRASLAGAYVGTSGWSYPSWRPDFYPGGTKPEDFLHHYAERLSRGVARRQRAVPVCPPARAAVLRRRPRGVGGAATAAPRRRHAGLLLLQARGRADRS